MTESFLKLRSEIEAAQSSFFKHFDFLPPEQKDAVISQVLKLNSTTPGGLVNYCVRGRQLLMNSSSSIKKKEYGQAKLGEVLKSNTPRFEESEELGISETPFACFVLVAGGLGERLSFQGVKVALQAETLTGKTFLENYCDWIFALQGRARIVLNQPDLTLPLAIMTSDDTHDEILKMLSSTPSGEMLGGLSDVTVLKQEKVPCFSSVRGELAFDSSTGKLITKPHGHGDVHCLLHKSGLLDRWLSLGKKWMVIFQDTNALSFRACCAGLGASARHDMDMNMIAVKRRPGEAIGVICQVDNERTLNVEYNLVNEQNFAATDGEKTWSIFPGNINLLILKLNSYSVALKNSGGIVPEFVNPKFANKEKTEFKSPARLECMMQDLPLLLREDARVGFTEMERFLCFSAVKNNLIDALQKYQETGYPESASSCESDIYATNRKLLAMSGVQIRTTGLSMRRIANLPFEDGAKIVLSPSFGTTVAEIRSRFPSPHCIRISDRSALVLDGDIVVHQLELDGCLYIKGVPGARIVIRNLRVMNDGCVLEGLEAENTTNSAFSSSSVPNHAENSVTSLSPNDIVRGYKLKHIENLTIFVPNPIETIIDRS